MTTHRVSAVLLVALVALAGCKKKRPADDAGDAQSGPAAPPKVLGFPAADPATGASAEKLIETFDKMAQDIGQDKAPSFWLTKFEPGQKGLARGAVAVDGTARKADLDASFGRFWAAWEFRPEQARLKVVRDQIDRMTKQGTPPDQAKAFAERSFPPPPTLKVTTPNPDLHRVLSGRIEADVPNGVRGEWSTNGDLRVTGSVRFTEALKVDCNGTLTARLRGSVGVLTLSANGDIIADVVEVQAPVVEVRPNGNVVLRVGPGTHTLRVAGNAISAMIMVRGNGGLKVEGFDQHHRRAVVVSY